MIAEIDAFYTKRTSSMGNTEPHGCPQARGVSKRGCAINRRLTIGSASD